MRDRIERLFAAVVARHRAADFEIYMTGTPVLTHELQAALTPDMARFTSLAVLRTSLTTAGGSSPS
jgi:hypothetical protein